MSLNKKFNSTPAGFKAEPGNGRVVDSKIYIGFVKNNVDQQRMGRLEVYIPELGGDPSDSSHWFIASYASPFAGVSDPSSMQAGSHTYDGSQQSYGWWGVPPDVENQVLVTFVNGDPNKCFWFACLYAQNMNHMVPGVAIDAAYDNNADNSLPPVVEYNRKDKTVNVGNPIRPRFDPLALGLQTQGLTGDFERGSASSSARREAPSRVFGYLTPRANQVYVDDNPDNEFIRLRTRSGTQVLVHETNGYVYINSGLGNSWIEVSDAGVDIYTKGSISCHAEQDFNVRADQNINLDAGADINVTAGGNIMTQSTGNTSMSAGGTLKLASTGDMTQLTSGQLLLTSKGDLQLASGANFSAAAGAGDVNFNASGDMITGAGGTHSTNAGTIVRQASSIQDNSGSAPTPSAPTQATQPDPVSTTPQNNGSSSVQSPVSRMPNHEPWNGHPKSKNATPPSGIKAGSFTADGTTQRVSTIKTTPGEGTTNVPPSSGVTTGDGKTKTVQAPDYTGTTVNVNNMSIRSDVLAAIQKAATITKMDYGQLMAMCWIESKFNPNAKAGTSSAYGLYQFIDDTWAAMVKKYGAKYNFTASMRSDVEAQAMCGAAYMAENKQYLVNNMAAGTKITATDLYLAHFLGPAGASKFLKANQSAPATTAVTPSQARANANIFKADATVQDVYNHFAGIMEPRSTAYAATWSGGTSTA